MAISLRDQSDSGLLTAAFSAIMGIPLSTIVSDSEQPEKISLFDHHKTTYSYGRVGDASTASATSDRCLLWIKLLNDKTIECDVKPKAKIEEIKTRIHELEGIASDQQRLIFKGKQLEDGKTMSDYNIECDSTIHLVARLRPNKPVILDPATLDPIHNYDFTHINDGNQVFTRGGYRYVRPCGFKRYALNVANRYENLLWIGCNNGVGEWPVSYHGTGEDGTKTMAQDGSGLTKNRQLSFTRGVYSTPEIQLAQKYAKRFTYNGEQYIVVFQNRVNPTTLIKLPSNQTGSGEYWVSPNDTDVRPYGICIRKV